MRPLDQRRLVVFDFDGTLADTKAGIISTATTVLTQWGLAPDELTNIADIIGPPFPQAYEQVFGLSHDDAVEVTRRYRDIYYGLGVEGWPAFAGVPELLADLHGAGRRLAIASSKKTDLVRRGLADNGILGLFDLVCAKGSDEETTKADAIAGALEAFGVTVDDAVMVGDRYHDVEAALACDVPCVGVLYGDTGSEEELVGAGAVAIAHTVAELHEILLGR